VEAAPPAEPEEAAPPPAEETAPPAAEEAAPPPAEEAAPPAAEEPAPPPPAEEAAPPPEEAPTESRLLGTWVRGGLEAQELLLVEAAAVGLDVTDLLHERARRRLHGRNGVCRLKEVSVPLPEG